MKLNEIQDIARERGVNPGRLAKIDLVRALQREEGSSNCFHTGQAHICGENSCLWREDCA